MKHLYVIFLLLFISGCNSTPAKKEVGSIEKIQPKYCLNTEECIKAIKEKVTKNWNKPSSINHINNPGVAEIKVAINKNGDLLHTKMTKSSGHASIDRSILAALYKSEPFREIKKLSPEESKIFRSIVFKFMPLN